MRRPLRHLLGPAAGLLLLSFLLSGCFSSLRLNRMPAGRELSLLVLDTEGEKRLLGGSDCKMTFVVIWATWCDGCREALAFADRLVLNAPESTQVVALSVDADPRLLGAWVREHEPAATVLWDREGQMVSRRLAIQRVPTLLVVDEQGRIRRVMEGWDRSSERLLARAVDSFLPEEPCSAGQKTPH